MVINDGGSAFPVAELSQNASTGEMTTHQAWGGMTLRDYFAAKALAGWIASTDQNRNPAEVADEIAGDCYSIADAMLRAREA